MQLLSMELMKAYDPELHKRAAHQAMDTRPGIAQLEREMPWKTSRRSKGAGPRAIVEGSTAAVADGFARVTAMLVAEGAESRRKGPQARAAAMQARKAQSMRRGGGYWDQPLLRGV